MPATKNSVEHYKSGTVSISFPDGDVRCQLCPLLETYSRRQCRMTGEYLAEGYLIGGLCPINFNEEDAPDV